MIVVGKRLWRRVLSDGGLWRCVGGTEDVMAEGRAGKGGRKEGGSVAAYVMLCLLLQEEW